MSPAGRPAPARPPLSRSRVLEAALMVADTDGLEALTMRRLGGELQVKAMSLYKHVANKDEVLDGLVELVVGEIELPQAGTPWKEAMRARARSARAVFCRHSWAIGLLESRPSMGPASLRYVDAVLGSLMAAGFTVEQAAHTFWTIDNFVYGQVVHEASLPLGTSTERVASGEPATLPSQAGVYPHLAALEEHASVVEYTVDGEFEFGLALILDGIERLIARS